MQGVARKFLSSVKYFNFAVREGGSCRRGGHLLGGSFRPGQPFQYKRALKWAPLRVRKPAVQGAELVSHHPRRFAELGDCCCGASELRFRRGIQPEASKPRPVFIRGPRHPGRKRSWVPI